MSEHQPYPVNPGEPAAQWQRGPQPETVGRAVRLIWVQIGLGLLSFVLSLIYLNTILDHTMEAAGASTLTESTARGIVIGGAVFGLVIGVGLTLVFAFLINKGANWARITYTVLSVIGILFTVIGWLNGSAGDQPVLLVALGAVQLVVMVAVLHLLWRKESSAWFAKPSFTS